MTNLITASSGIAAQSEDRKQFMLSAIRAAVLRVKLIETELVSIGHALKADWISPEMALAWADEVAPGCLHYIPPSISSSIGIAA
jgi:hypothetical protein